MNSSATSEWKSEKEILLEKKLKCVQRTKLALKNQLNSKIEKLEAEKQELLEKTEELEKIISQRDQTITTLRTGDCWNVLDTI
jgi:hypothetical protein|tara:strand:+ start:149 stop:397 length:249 start_codon:yes stop_codon:yes gene_type:complete